jgi:F0F1-type ATP synthase assembly protein I
MRSLTIWQAVSIAAEAGALMAAAVLVGLFFGHLIDDKVGGEFPIFTVGGAMIGLASGVISLIRAARYLTSPRKE